MEFKHKSVLLEETIDGLRVNLMVLMWMELWEEQGTHRKCAADFLPRGDLLA